MVIFDDVFTWEGWGGKLRLGSGRCRLKIFDLRKIPDKTVVFFKPFLVVASDLPREKPQEMSVKSCNSHIATSVARRFRIDPNRMQFVEYYPEDAYGVQGEHVMAERFEAVDFTWYEDRAMKPVYRQIDTALRDLIRHLLQGGR